MFFLLLLSGLFLLFMWIGAIIDIVRSEFRDQNEKIIWVLLVALLPLIGTILYAVMGSRNKISSNGY